MTAWVVVKGEKGNMKKRIGILVGLIVAVFLVGASILIIKNQPEKVVATVEFATIDTVREMAEKMDLSNYNPESIIAANADNGRLNEKVKGDKSAPVVIYEYADYACSHCAEMNTEINRI